MNLENKCSAELYHSFMNIPCWLKNILIWASQHQGLVGAFFAVCAASFAYKQVSQQLKQVEKNRRKDIETNDKALLEAFSFKVFSYVDNVGRMQRHIREIRADHPDFDDVKLWKVFKPVLPDGIDLPSLDEKDVAILSKIGELNKFAGATRLHRSAKTIINIVNKYDLLRTEWNERATEFTNFRGGSGHFAGTTEFNAKEHPHLVRLMGQQSELIASLIKYTREANQFSVGYSKDISSVFEKHKVFRFELRDGDK